MAPPYTNEEKDKMRNGRFLPNRTQEAVGKKRNRLARNAKRERQSLILAEDWLQPSLTPESFLHSATNYHERTTATPSLGRQAAAQNHQYELAKRVADLADRAEHLHGKVAEVNAAMQENTRRAAQLKKLAKLPDFVDLMNQHDEPTYIVSDFPAALTLSSIALPVLSTSVNPPPNAEKDLFVGPDFFQFEDEIASSAHEAGSEIRPGPNTQTSVAFVGHANSFADGIGEGPSNDMVLRVVTDRQVEAMTESLGIEENYAEEFDPGQYLDLAGVEEMMKTM